MPKKVYSLPSTVHRGSQKSEVGRHKKGFTLVELLIVISIIAVLSVVGIVSYTNFLKNARDAKRQSDIKFIQSALEQYFADQKYYPYSDSIISGQPLTNATGAPPGTTISKTYLNTVPSDPTGSTPYSYKAYKQDNTNCTNTDVTECVKYCLSANLEGSDPLDDCPPPSGYNFGVTRP